MSAKCNFYDILRKLLNDIFLFLAMDINHACLLLTMLYIFTIKIIFMFQAFTLPIWSLYHLVCNTLFDKQAEIFLFSNIIQSVYPRCHLELIDTWKSHYLLWSGKVGNWIAGLICVRTKPSKCWQWTLDLEDGSLRQRINQGLTPWAAN